jgi:hypothetical protein
MGFESLIIGEQWGCSYKIFTFWWNETKGKAKGWSFEMDRHNNLSMLSFFFVDYYYIK